MKWIFKHNPG